MLITEWNMEEAREVWQEEAHEKGLIQGREEGLERGREQVLKLLEQGLSIEEIKQKF
jgi:predicted transposase YdaD